MLNIVIIGAPRSGTNMLRDVLVAMPSVATWPCDEINYIWRHGNVRFPSDEFPEDRARPRVVRYIRKKFMWVAESYKVNTVVEKTCANSLRVPFVDRVLPDARYIHIVRDGIDATGSAKLRWSASIDFPYILKKMRFVPLFDLPYYAGRYLWSHAYRILSGRKRLAFWGPALEDMDAIVKNHSLNEICALQWQRCVDNADSAFTSMPDSKMIQVRYEDFVRAPEKVLAKILEFMEVDYQHDDLVRAVQGVSDKSIGKGRASLTSEEIRKLEDLIGDTLSRHGYSSTD